MTSSGKVQRLEVVAEGAAPHDSAGPMNRLNEPPFEIPLHKTDVYRLSNKLYDANSRETPS